MSEDPKFDFQITPFNPATSELALRDQEAVNSIVEVLAQPKIPDIHLAIAVDNYKRLPSERQRRDVLLAVMRLVNEQTSDVRITTWLDIDFYKDHQNAIHAYKMLAKSDDPSDQQALVSLADNMSQAMAAKLEYVSLVDMSVPRLAEYFASSIHEVMRLFKPELFDERIARKMERDGETQEDLAEDEYNSRSNYYLMNEVLEAIMTYREHEADEIWTALLKELKERESVFNREDILELAVRHQALATFLLAASELRDEVDTTPWEEHPDRRGDYRSFES